MSRHLTAADRSALIRLAATLPAGSPERRSILAGLDRVATKYYTTQEAMDKYLKEHPKADKSKHKVQKNTGGASGYGLPLEDLAKYVKSWRNNRSTTTEERKERRKVVKAVADLALDKFRKDPNKDKIIAKAIAYDESDESGDDDGDYTDNLLMDIRETVLRGTGITGDGDAEDEVIDYLMDEISKMVGDHMKEADKKKKSG